MAPPLAMTVNRNAKEHDVIASVAKQSPLSLILPGWSALLPVCVR